MSKFFNRDLVLKTVGLVGAAVGIGAATTIGFLGKKNTAENLPSDKQKTAPAIDTTEKIFFPKA